MTRPRILIAGIGNIFLGDDAFGVEVAHRLLGRQLPAEVRVVDFGIRGLDLAYALLDGYESVVLVDAAPRGQLPGTVYLLEPSLDAPPGSSGAGLLDAHSMEPLKVLQAAVSMGARLDHLLLVGCEPTPLVEEEMQDGLSDPVRAAVDDAVCFIEDLVARLLRRDKLVTT